MPSDKDTGIENSENPTDAQPADVSEISDRVKYDPPDLLSFLDSVFHSRRDDEFILTWIVRNRPGYPVPSGELETLKRVSAPRALYYGTSTCHQDKDGQLYNRQSLFDRLHVVVLDDIGTKVDPNTFPEALRHPSYIMETSPGNFQWGYILDVPIDNPDHAKVLVQLVYDSGFTDAGGAMPTKLVRLPGGVNGKPGPNQNFRVKLTEMNGGHWSPQGLLKAIECDTSWAEVQKSGTDALKRPQARSVTPWSPIQPASPNTDGEIDPVLEWLYAQDMVKQETGQWVTIECPWSKLHTDGDGTAGYSPLGRGDEDYTLFRGFHCFHDHCKDRHGADFLTWVASEGGPEAPVKDLRSRLTQNWVYDPTNEVAIQIRGDEVVDAPVKLSALKALYPNKVRVPQFDGKWKLIDEVSLWLCHPARIIVSGSIMDPTSDSPLVRDRVLHVNTFKRPQWGEGEIFEDDIEMFVEFIDYLIPEGTEREYFLDWMASKVVTPAFRGAGILMVAGAQGTGRGTLADMFRTLLGKSNTADLTFDRLVSDAEFNEWQLNPLVIVNETLDLGEKKFYRAYERLKGLIEVSPTMASVNIKYQRPRNMSIHSSYLMFSNHTAALSVANADRRIYVIENPSVPAGKEYFEKLYNWLEEIDPETGRPAWAPSVYRWLKQREVKSDLLAPVPMTEGKERMREATRSPVDRAVTACVNSWQGRFITVRRVLQVVEALSHRLGIDGNTKLREHVGHRLNEHTVALHQSYRCRIDGTQVRPKLLRAHLTDDTRKFTNTPELILGVELADEMAPNTREALVQAVTEELDLQDR